MPGLCAAELRPEARCISSLMHLSLSLSLSAWHSRTGRCSRLVAECRGAPLARGRGSLSSCVVASRVGGWARCLRVWSGAGACWCAPVALRGWGAERSRVLGCCVRRWWRFSVRGCWRRRLGVLRRLGTSVRRWGASLIVRGFRGARSMSCSPTVRSAWRRSWRMSSARSAGSWPPRGWRAWGGVSGFVRACG